MSAGRGGGERAYRAAVNGFSLVFVAMGIAVLVVTFANGGGPASVGVLLGVALLLVGAGRLWLNARGRG
ncbi:MAG: hypothetical protein ACM3NV_10105 [Syntrophothermus sp.]